MKRLFLIALLAVVSFACENNEVNKPPLNYSTLINNLDITFKNAFEVALDSRHENVSETTLKYLKDNYYESDFELTTQIWD